MPDPRRGLPDNRYSNNNNDRNNNDYYNRYRSNVPSYRHRTEDNSVEDIADLPANYYDRLNINNRRRFGRSVDDAWTLRDTGQDAEEISSENSIVHRQRVNTPQQRTNTVDTADAAAVVDFSDKDASVVSQSSSKSSLTENDRSRRHLRHRRRHKRDAASSYRHETSRHRQEEDR